MADPYQELYSTVSKLRIRMLMYRAFRPWSSEQCDQASSWQLHVSLCHAHRQQHRAACVRAGHRVLLFSQMTRVLDVIQDYADVRAIPHLRLDGTTRSQDRRAPTLAPFHSSFFTSPTCVDACLRPAYSELLTFCVHGSCRSTHT